MLSALLEYAFVVLTCESFLPFLARMRGNATFAVLNLEGVLVSKGFCPLFFLQCFLHQSCAFCMDGYIKVKEYTRFIYLSFYYLVLFTICIILLSFFLMV